MSSGRTTPTSSSSNRSYDRRVGQDLPQDPVDCDLQFEEADKMSSVLPTMWLASQSGRYVWTVVLVNYTNQGPLWM